jgi:hypothetical protein
MHKTSVAPAIAISHADVLLAASLLLRDGLVSASFVALAPMASVSFSGKR